MSLTTPDTIRTLQRKLYAKAKQAHADVADSSTEFGGSTHSVALDQHETRDCACLGVKNIGKPCAGKSHARFDEGGQAKACPLLYLDAPASGISRAVIVEHESTQKTQERMERRKKTGFLPLAPSPSKTFGQESL